MSASGVRVDAGEESDPENPTPAHRRSLRETTAPIKSFKHIYVYFGWREATTPAEAPPSYAAVTGATAGETEYEFVWDPELGREVKVARSSAASAAAQATPAFPAPTPEQLKELIEARMLIFKANGELLNYKRGLRVQPEPADVDPPAPFDPADAVRARVDIDYEPDKEGAVIFFVIGRETCRAPLNLDRVTCRFEYWTINGTKQELAWINLRDAILPGASLIVPCALVNDHTTPAGENSWVIERLGYTHQQACWSDTAPLRRDLQKHLLPWLGRTNPRLVDTSKTTTIFNDPLLTLGLSWDFKEHNRDADLDLSVVVVQFDYGLRFDFITYNSPSFLNGVVQHSGDATFGSSPRRRELNGADEQVIIRTDQLPAQVVAVYIVVTCPQALVAGKEERNENGPLLTGFPRGYLTLTEGANDTFKVGKAVAPNWHGSTGKIVWALRPPKDSPQWTATEVMFGFSGSHPSDGCEFLEQCASDIVWPGRKEKAVEVSMDNTPHGLKTCLFAPEPRNMDVIASRPVDYPLAAREAEDDLFIHLVRGVDLIPIDKPNIYVKISIDPKSKQQNKSAVIKGVLSPKWNETFHIKGPFAPGTRFIFEVLQKELLSSKNLGTTVVAIADTHIRGPHVCHLEGVTPVHEREATGFLVIAFAWGNEANLHTKAHTAASGGGASASA